MKNLKGLTLLLFGILFLTTSCTKKGAHSIRGYVIEKGSGLPIASAEVLIEGKLQDRFETTTGTWSIQTDEEGYYEILNQNLGHHTVIDIEADGYAKGREVVDHLESEIYFEIEMTPFAYVNINTVATSDNEYLKIFAYIINGDFVEMAPNSTENLMIPADHNKNLFVEYYDLNNNHIKQERFSFSLEKGETGKLNINM